MASMYDVLVGAGQKADLAEIVSDETRLLVREIVKNTPPKNQRQGENAIKVDLFGGRKLSNGGRSVGIFFPANDAMIKESRVVKIRGIPANQMFVTKAGEVWGIDRANFYPDAPLRTLYEVHQKARRPSDGRTSAAGGWSRNVGRWRFMNAIVTNKAKLTLYFNWIKRRVGLSKATWARVGVALGDTTYPSWITRHLDTVKKMSRFEPSLEGGAPSIRFGSSARINQQQMRGIRFSIYLRTKRLISRVRFLTRFYKEDIGRDGVARFHARATALAGDNSATYK